MKTTKRIVLLFCILSTILLLSDWYDRGAYEDFTTYTKNLINQFRKID